MSLDEQIDYWRNAANAAATKQAALVAFGVVVGLTHAKAAIEAERANEMQSRARR